MKFPFTTREDEKDKKEDEIELKPEEVKKKLDKIDSIETTVNGFNEKLKGLDSVTAYIARQEREEKDRKEAAARKAREVAEAKETEDLDFFGDPAAAVKHLVDKSVQPLVTNAVQQAARNNAYEFFQGDSRFEYFDDPAFKQEVMRLIYSVPPGSMNSNETFENCYHVVAGRKAQEIKEGKIKSRFAAASSSGGGTGATTGTSEKTITLSEDQKKAAKMFGMTEKEYAEGVKKEQGVSAYV